MTRPAREGRHHLTLDAADAIALLAHLLHLDMAVILRTHPQELERRLSGFDYPEEKIRENVEAEALAVITTEALGRFDRIYEVNTTEISGETITLSWDTTITGDGTMDLVARAIGTEAELDSEPVAVIVDNAEPTASIRLFSMSVLAGDTVVTIMTPESPVFLDAAETAQLIAPGPYFRPQSEIAIIDVEDRSQPTLVSRVRLDGSVNTSRMVERELYVVTVNYPDVFIEPFVDGQVD